MVLVALDSIWIRGVGFMVTRRGGMRGRDGGNFVHGSGGQRSTCHPNTTSCCLDRRYVIGSRRGVLVISTERSLTTLRVSASMLTARPLSISEQAGMEHPL